MVSPALAPWVEYLSRLPLVDREVLLNDMRSYAGLAVIQLQRVLEPKRQVQQQVWK